MLQCITGKTRRDRQAPIAGREEIMVQSLGSILPEAARRYGDKTALVIDGRRFSFNDLEHHSNAFANGLVEAGVAPGDIVTLYGPNAWQWLVAYYAIAKAGAVVNPINTMLTPAEVKYIIQDSGARAVVASDDKAAALMDMKGSTGLKQVVIWGDKVPAGAARFDDWLSNGKASFRWFGREEKAKFSPRAPGPKETGAICYTSGTTGHPKGAVQSVRSIMWAAKGMALMGSRTATDTVVSPLPCPHVYGSIAFNAAMLAGSTFVMLARFSEEGVLDAIQSNRATILDGVPTAYYYLLAHPKFGRYNLSSLTRCTVGGQTLPAAKSIEFTERTGAPVLELWGMTELAGAATFNPYWGENKPGTIGLALPGMACKIVAADDPDKELPQGERGELMLRGPMVMDRYAGDEAATRATVRADGWMHTGDIATVDEDGYYSIVDRKKDMILTAGYNVYPAELERVLCMHPSVALAAVCGVADEAKGELAKAYVMLKPGASASGKDLAEHCRQHLAAYKVPRAVQFVDNVPITSSGKIMRRLLRDVDDGQRVVSETPTTRSG
jgi:long-chain acyl-CoA synthetase